MTKEIPKLPDISRFSQLDQLIITGAKLVELHPSIGNLTNLEMLVLADNKLKSLPKEIGNLKKLRFLLLKDNLALTTLPKSITQLPNLDILNLNGCDNITFPKNFENYFESIGGNLFEKL